MNRQRRVTLEQLAQAEPHTPTCQASDFSADKLRVLEALEQVGAAGLTTRELMERGGGMRPPNRIGELRKDGHAIKTISEGRRVYRYILCKFLPEEKSTAPENAALASRENPSDWYQRKHGPRPSAPDPDAFRLTPPEPRP